MLTVPARQTCRVPQIRRTITTSTTDNCNTRTPSSAVDSSQPLTYPTSVASIRTRQLHHNSRISKEYYQRSSNLCSIAASFCKTRAVRVRFQSVDRKWYILKMGEALQISPWAMATVITRLCWAETSIYNSSNRVQIMLKKTVERTRWGRLLSRTLIQGKRC